VSGREAAAADVPPAEAIRALRDAVAAIGRIILPNAEREDGNRVLVRLGAVLPDVQALSDYLGRHPRQE
jgi:hypothetical protein